jgi:HK97 family phage major capsid protein
MPAIKDLEHEIKSLGQKGLDLVTIDERPYSEKAAEIAKVEADLKAKVTERSNLVDADTKAGAFRAALEDGTPVEPAAAAAADRFEAAGQTKSIGEQFVESASYKATTFGVRGASAAVDTKSTFTVASGAAGGVFPTYQTGVVPILLRRLTLAQLLPGGAISGGSLIYPKESSITNAAAAVAEGGAKPGSDLNVVQVTENLTKIATSLKVSDETLQDFAAAQSYIDGRLGLFVQLEEENQLLNGSGSGVNVTGLLNRSGLATAQAKGSDSAIDAIFKQITRIRSVSFVDPDGIVINPTDWQGIKLSKDSNGQYYAGGPFTGAYGTSQPGGDSLWGLPVVVTPLIAAGTALVGSFAMCAQVFRKGGLRIEATNSNEDDFLNNLVAVRAEIRELLAVYRPSGFGKVTGL